MHTLINQIRRLLFFLILLVGFASPAPAIDFGAYWDYSQSGAEGVETKHDFRQRYYLRLGEALTFKPSHAIRGEVSVSYTARETDRGGGQSGFVGTRVLSPRAKVSLRNDIIWVDLSGNSGQYTNDSGRKRSSGNWSLSMGNAWGGVPLWPEFSFSYSEFVNLGGNLLTPPDLATKQKNTSFGLNWDLILAQFSYGYRKGQTINPRSGSTFENQSHFARLDTDGSFWDKRISFKLNQQLGYSSQSSQFEGSSLTLEVEGVVREEESSLNPIDSDYLPDILPGQSWPDNISIPVDPETGVVDGKRLHIIFNTSSGIEEQIDFLLLSFETALSTELVNNMNWGLYVRDALGDWRYEQEITIGDGDYNEDDRLLTIPIDREESDLMIVAENNTGDALSMNKLEAFYVLTREGGSSPETSRINSVTTFNLRYRIARNLTSSFNLTQQFTENKSNNIGIRTDRQNLSARLSWIPFSAVSSSIGFNQYKEGGDFRSDILNRFYSFSLNTRPMRRVTLGFGGSYRESVQDDLKISYGNTYNLRSSAVLYPTLTAGLGVAYSSRNTLDNDDLYSNTTSLSSSFSLSAKLRRRLTAGLSASWRQTEIDSGSSVQTSSGGLTISYNPSDILSVRGSYSADFEDLSSNKLSLRAAMKLLETEKTRLNCTLTHSQQSGAMSNRLSWNGSWKIRNNMALRANGRWRIGGNNAYNFNLFLNLTL